MTGHSISGRPIRSIWCRGNEKPFDGSKEGGWAACSKTERRQRCRPNNTVGYGLYDIAAIISIVTYLTLRTVLLKKAARQTAEPDVRTKS